MSGQATVEFGLVIGVVLLLILGAVQVGLYAVERNNALSATEQGVLTAVSAQSSPAGRPAAAEAVFTAISIQLDAGLFGAHAVRSDAVGGVCPALSPTWPVGEVHVCSQYNAATGTVTVSVRGWVPALVPPHFGISGGRDWALGLDLHEVAHVATFSA
ncbi:MAG: pilus assembly protein [Candidatus Dormibacteraeota bacterium]|uniref:Pilus assembly protein n=1 Tax=Candidatus Aeolococcus gillhamiae TaxID=3127015 RepID=A0A934NB55_9BACT|nr:pilus assembly protein [Candidatus Dormibacteraeota bacterium]